MLRKESVSDTRFEVLIQLMHLPNLSRHRLVGGVALALQLTPQWNLSQAGN
jgi:hypothetical protein